MTRPASESRVLVAYSTVDGHTRLICQRLRDPLTAAGHLVTLASLDPGAAIDLSPFAKVVIGASIRYGKYRPEVLRFITRHRAALDRVPSALFSVDLVSRKRGKDTLAGNPYLKKLLQEARWRPRHVAVFAGKLDYPRYGVVDRSIVRLIMLLTGGPTDPAACVEFTDWDKVRAFGRRIANDERDSA